MEKVDIFFEKQLERTNYWLSFAEAKNAAIVALNIAFVAAWRQIFDKSSVLFLVIVVLFASSIIIGLVSFFPNLSLFSNTTTSASSDLSKKSNMIYFGKLAQIKSPDIYIANVLEKYFNKSINIKEVSPMVYDFAEEIIINSNIAIKKYSLFKIAVVIDIFAFSLLIIALIIA